MKLIEGLKMRKLGKDYIVIPEGVRLVNFNRMVSLNESAAYLWQNVEGKEFSVEDLKQLLLSKYGIDEGTAGEDAAKLVKAWQEAGLIAE